MNIHATFRMAFVASLYLLSSVSICAQGPEAAKQNEAPLAWTVQESGTTASLRGIDAVDKNIAWASGTSGTILHTNDGGDHWSKCPVPDAATDGTLLDFRGIQAWDQKTAVVMSSGPGEKSRLYKTTDACASWSLLLKNPDKDGFWDAISVADQMNLVIMGDPVSEQFCVFDSEDGGETWNKMNDRGLRGNPKEGAFAASNSSLFIDWIDGPMIFGTGGPNGAQIFQECETCAKGSQWTATHVAAFPAISSGGIFAIATHSDEDVFRNVVVRKEVWIAVGGDYAKPAESSGTAAYSLDGGKTWIAATKPPHGYRSSVAWSNQLNAWIAVGTNGSDISHDDGKTWRPLDEGNWNAASLPFVVGPKGRIARLHPR